MMLDKYEQKEKEFIKLEAELEKLREEIRNRPLIPYEKPVHHGWMVLFEMRADIANRDDSYDIQQAIDIGYRPQHVRNVKHIKMMRAGIKGYFYTDRRGRRRWMKFGPHLAYIDGKDFERMPPVLKKYFILNRYDERVQNRGKFIIDIPDYWKVLKARPHYLTHYRERGGEMEKRKAFIEDKLEEYYRRLSYNSRWREKRTYRPKTRESIKRFLKHESEDIPQMTQKEAKR